MVNRVNGQDLESHCFDEMTIRICDLTCRRHFFSFVFVDVMVFLAVQGCDDHIFRHAISTGDAMTTSHGDEL